MQFMVLTFSVLNPLKSRLVKPVYCKNLQKIIRIRIDSFPIRIRKGTNGFPYCMLRHAYYRSKQQRTDY